MLGLVARDWWVFAIRGIAAIVFGILAFIWPERTLTVLVFLFGAYVFVDGVALLVALARGDAEARRNAWAVGIMGVLGIVVGVATFVWPGLTALTLLYLVAFWAIATGAPPGHRGHRPPARARRRVLDGTRWRGLDRVRRTAHRLPRRRADHARVARRDLGDRVRGLEPRPRESAPHGRRGHARVCRVAPTCSGRDRPRGLQAADDRVDEQEQRWERWQRRSQRCVSTAEPTNIREGQDARERRRSCGRRCRWGSPRR